MIDPRDVRRARAGDLEAFGRLVDQVQERSLRTARARLGDAHLAADAVQDALLAAFRSLASLRDEAAFGPWFGVLLRRAIGRLARRRRPTEDVADGLPSTERPPAEAAGAAELRARVLAAIATLPDSQRETTRLYYLGGYSTAEVADRLGVPVTTVKKRLHDARRRLRRRLPPSARAARPGPYSSVAAGRPRTSSTNSISSPFFIAPSIAL